MDGGTPPLARAREYGVVLAPFPSWSFWDASEDLNFF